MKTSTKSAGVSFQVSLALLSGGIAAQMTNVVAHADTVTTVKKGQTLKSIAKDNHVTVESLAKANNLSKDAKVSVADKLKVPDAPKTYTVKEGDSVSLIAHEYGLNTADLLEWNNLSWDNSTIYVGDKLNLQNPDTKQTNQTTNTTASPQKISAHDAEVIGDTQAEQIVNLAKQYANMGIPYTWGGKTPTSGFDCSGLTQYVYGQAGISIGVNTIAQEANVQSTDISDASQVASVARPGDLLFWGSHGSTYHVAIYIGNGQFVAAPQPGQNVSVQTVSNYFMPSFVGHVVK